MTLSIVSGLHLRDLRQEVPDRQDPRSSLQGGPLEQQAVRLQPLRLPRRPEGLSHRSQPLGAREVEAVRVRALRLQDHLTKHTQRAQSGEPRLFIVGYKFASRWP